MYSNQQNPTPMRIAARYALFSTASAKDLTVTISIKFFTNFELVIAQTHPQFDRQTNTRFRYFIRTYRISISRFEVIQLFI